MKILSWNVNGIRALAEKGFLKWFEKESPDILCLQETKAQPDQLDESIVKPKGYTSYWNSPVRKGYAGVAVYTKKKPLSVKKDFGPASFDTEGRALILEYKDFLLMNVYFPNGRMGTGRLEYKLTFYEEFLNLYRNAYPTKDFIKALFQRKAVLTPRLIVKNYKFRKRMRALRSHHDLIEVPEKF